MNRKEFLKTGLLAAAAMGAAPALISWIPKFKQNPAWIPKGGFTIAELNAIVEEYYGDPDDVSAVARARKMQALIMELTIKAKTRNPKFQIVPQDTLEYAHIDGNANNAYDWKFLNLIDGWGIENFSATTVSRLANLSKVGIKGTANTYGRTVQVVADNQKIAADNNILWHPRLSAEVYQSPGIGNPGYTPIYSPASNSYNINHDPIPAGVAHTLNSNNVNSMSDAKNHLYMISTGKYSNWPDWETNPARRLDITSNAGYLVPFKGGRFQAYRSCGGGCSRRSQTTALNGTFFGWPKATIKMKAGRPILRISRPQSGMLFILTRISAGVLLPRKRLNPLNVNPRAAGGRLLRI